MKVRISQQKQQFVSKEYSKINPMNKVPAISEVDAKTGEILFSLGESHAIMRYLAQAHKSKVADHWYPMKDLRH